MSEQAGASHALNEKIWGIREYIIEDGKFYNIVKCNGSTGQVIGKSWNTDAARTREILERSKSGETDYHVFIYPAYEGDL